MVTIHLTINHSTRSDTTATACDSLLWLGTTYTASGIFNSQFSILNSNSCDSTITLHLTIHHPYHLATWPTACDSFSWAGYSGLTYTASGTYLYPHPDANGCTQTDTLHLTINHSTTSDTTAQACDSLLWHGTTYRVSGDFNSQSPLLNSQSCDSTITLHLTINHSSASTLALTACDGYTWNGILYTTSGTYTSQSSTPNSQGCDSTATLHLTIAHPSSGDTTATACDRFSWHGITYTESGTFNSHFSILNSQSCDSTIRLHLTIHRSTTSSQTLTATDSLRWHGTEYRNSGTYRFDTLNAAGCDSTALLHLTIQHIYHRITLRTEDPTRGIVYPDGTSIIRHGRNFRAVATCMRGYLFLGWYDGDTPVSRANPYPFTATTDLTLTARFRPIDGLRPDSLVLYLTLTDPLCGTTTPAPGRHVYYYGDQITLTATPAPGNYLEGWQANPTSYSQTTSTYRLRVDSTLLGQIIEIQALLRPDPQVLYTISASPFNPSMGEAIGSGRYLSGTPVSLLAVPYPGYKFTGWSNGQTDELLLFNATSDLTLTAYFAPDGTLGINDLPADSIRIYTLGATIHIFGAEGRTLTLYDISGRLLLRHRATAFHTALPAPAAGVYLLRPDSLPARRLIILP